MYAQQTGDLPPMTEAEYLAFDERSEIRHEYRQGRVVAMSGGSVRHGVITANTSRHLGNLLADRDCSVTSPDVRVQIAHRQTYRYPDVTVFCGAAAYTAGWTDTITNPVLLVEVLSPESAVRDYNEKLEEYTQIDTLQAYVIVSQHHAKVEVFRRQGDQWLYAFATGLDAMMMAPVGGVDITLELAQLYHRVTWDDDHPDTP